MTDWQPRDVTVQFMLTRADRAAWLSLPRDLQGWRRRLPFFFAALLGAGWAILDPVDLRESGWRTALFVLMMLVASYVLTALVLTLDRWRKLRRYPAMAQITMTVSHGDILWNEDGMQRTIPLASVADILSARDHVFLFMPDGADLILPRHAFAQDPDADRWIGHIRLKNGRAPQEKAPRDR